MNAPPFPLNPAIGEFFGNWVWNGARWVCTPSAGVRVITTVFTASGPYQPSPGLVTAVVECVGGGGGGGGAVGGLSGPPATADAWMMSGGGGASGGYSRVALAAALVAGGVNVTIGAGGAGGVSAGSGAVGGTTSFGAMCVANGGGGAGAGVAVPFSVGVGGARSPVGVGDLAVYGDGGEHGQVIMYDSGLGQVFLWGGRGGGSHFQSAAVGALQSPTGGDGSPGDFGAGGGGGASPYTSGPANGGAGGAGLCVVTEYCWADTSGVDDCCGPTMNVNARVAVTHEPFDPCPPGSRPYVDHRGGFDE